MCQSDELCLLHYLYLTCGAGPRQSFGANNCYDDMPEIQGLFLTSTYIGDAGPPVATVPRALHGNCVFGALDISVSAHICSRVTMRIGHLGFRTTYSLKYILH